MSLSTTCLDNVAEFVHGTASSVGRPHLDIKQGITVHNDNRKILISHTQVYTPDSQTHYNLLLHEFQF